jgi:hypothetical protein
MHIQESYKMRLKELAGMVYEAPDDPYVNRKQRVPFSVELMTDAINYGMEIGMLFQSNNTKYRMPIAKYRIIKPVALGYDENGDMVVRGVHVEGQSEKEAIITGRRSAEASNVWRLFKTKNIKNMFFTGNYFSQVPIGGYKKGDSAMSNIIVQFDASTAKKNQANQSKLDSSREEKVKQQQQLAPKDFQKRLGIKPETKATTTTGTQKPTPTIRPLFKGQEVERSI